MSKFFSEKYKELEPYTPGEQPRERKYVKLNTNESPFPPSPLAQRLARQAAGDLQLYSDPRCRDLLATASEKFGVPEECIIFTNGSDDVLNFAFMAFCDEKHPAAFPDITYGFYPVFAKLNGVPYREIPLNEDFTLNAEDYLSGGETLFIANPNAPTGIALPLSDIEKIVASDPDRVVVVDEAYVDFGGESAVSLTEKYDNLLVTGTFSKSRSLAGARLGFGIGAASLIADLNTIRYSTNPYNINRMTAAAGIGALCDEEYTKKNCLTVMKTREKTKAELISMGFEVTDSKTNFVFAKTAKIGGQALYLALKERGILVRHFETERLKDYNRITIGSMEQMQELIDVLKELLK